MTDPAPGTIVLLSSVLGRYSATAQCLLDLDRPAGSRVLWQAGGLNIPANRNDIGRDFVGDWLLMIDDDHTFQPDLLRRLLSHFADDRVDIVVPVVLMKVPGLLTSIATAPADPDQWPLPLLTLTNQRGLQPIHAAATAVMLIRRRVFERVAPPWFEHHPRGYGHDHYFCLKARAAGCGVYCDFDVSVGHITPIAIWPVRDNSGQWRPNLQTILPGDQAYTRELTRIAAEGLMPRFELG